MLVVIGAVIELNVLNTKYGSKFNETDQREQLSELIITLRQLVVFHARNEGVTKQWGEW